LNSEIGFSFQCFSVLPSRNHSMSLTVLFSSAGRRVALIQCFRDDARRLGVGVRLLAVDLDPAQSAACQAADACFPVPRCTDAGFIPAMLEICRRENVALLVPTIDTELSVLAAHRDDFAAIGTRVAISSPDVVAVARDKSRTAEVLAAAGIAVPRTAPLEALLDAPGSWGWPVVLKPIGGSSSVGMQIVHSTEEAQRLAVVAGGVARAAVYRKQRLARGRDDAAV